MHAALKFFLSDVFQIVGLSRQRRVRKSSWRDSRRFWRRTTLTCKFLILCLICYGDSWGRSERLIRRFTTNYIWKSFLGDCPISLRKPRVDNKGLEVFENKQCFQSHLWETQSQTTSKSRFSSLCWTIMKLLHVLSFPVHLSTMSVFVLSGQRGREWKQRLEELGRRDGESEVRTDVLRGWEQNSCSPEKGRRREWKDVDEVTHPSLLLPRCSGRNYFLL